MANKKNRLVFIAFAVVSLIDIVATYIGVRRNYFAEANFVVIYLTEYSGLSIYVVMMAVKLIAFFFGFWVIFYLPQAVQNDKVKKRIFFTSLLPEGAPRKLLLILTVFTAIFGAIPALVCVIRSSIYSA